LGGAAFAGEATTAFAGDGTGAFMGVAAFALEALLVLEVI
jgi:hypothetical protein